MHVKVVYVVQRSVTPLFLFVSVQSVPFLIYGDMSPIFHSFGMCSICQMSWASRCLLLRMFPLFWSVLLVCYIYHVICHSSVLRWWRITSSCLGDSSYFSLVCSSTCCPLSSCPSSGLSCCPECSFHPLKMFLGLPIIFLCLSCTRFIQDAHSLSQKSIISWSITFYNREYVLIRLPCTYYSP